MSTDQLIQKCITVFGGEASEYRFVEERYSCLIYRDDVRVGSICMRCGKVGIDNTLMGKICYQCQQKAEKAEKQAILDGAVCTCSVCGNVRENGYDYSTGKVRAGERVGLCYSCFEGRVNKLTDLIDATNRPANTLLTVLADGGSRSPLVDQIIKRSEARKKFRAQFTARCPRPPFRYR